MEPCHQLTTRWGPTVRHLSAFRRRIRSSSSSERFPPDALIEYYDMTDAQKRIVDPVPSPARLPTHSGDNKTVGIPRRLCSTSVLGLATLPGWQFLHERAGARQPYDRFP